MFIKNEAQAYRIDYAQAAMSIEKKGMRLIYLEPTRGATQE